MNPLVAYEAAIVHMADLHRKAEHARLVRVARRAAKPDGPGPRRKLQA